MRGKAKGLKRMDERGMKGSGNATLEKRITRDLEGTSASLSSPETKASDATARNTLWLRYIVAKTDCHENASTTVLLSLYSEKKTCRPR